MPIDDNEPGTGTPVTGPAAPPAPTPGTGASTYIKIAVPNFLGAALDKPQMQSYLRLGAVEDLVPPGQPFPTVNGVDITGEDLAALVTAADGSTTFANDTRNRGDGTETPPAAAQSLPPGSPSKTLVEESSRIGLHGKGGWRDHTDGNRITTTRGDKIEVIRGNYKMLILGRQTLGLDPKGDYYFDEWATGLDESGGLSDNQDQAHGVNGVLDISYTWQKNSDGRFGWTQVTRTGTPNPSEKRSSQGNGKQITYTWVDEIWTYVGSSPPDTSQAPAVPVVLSLDDSGTPKPVKMMVSKTWAETIVQETNAVTISEGAVSWDDNWNDNVTVIGPKVATDPVRVASISSTTVSEGDITSVSRSFGVTSNSTEGHGGIKNTTSGGSIENHTTCTGDIYETTSCRTAHINFDMAPFMIFNMAFSALVMEIKALIHLDLHLGIHADFHVGEHFDVHTGEHSQFENFHVEAGLEYSAVKALKEEIAGGTLHLSATEARIAGMISLG